MMDEKYNSNLSETLTKIGENQLSTVFKHYALKGPNMMTFWHTWIKLSTRMQTLEETSSKSQGHSSNFAPLLFTCVLFKVEIANDVIIPL